MLAVIKKVHNGHVATYERHFPHPVADVWAMLVVNEKLAQWFAELSIEDLRKDGLIKFDMQDGTYETMSILELEPEAVLAFTWGNDEVRFELSAAEAGCKLIFTEILYSITEHTPKDLAGWHVCLDVIALLLNGQMMEARREQWEKVYPEYVKLVEAAKQS